MEEMLEAKNDEGGWRWYHHTDGRKYISVTKSMDHIVAETLQNWMRKNSAAKQKKVLDHAANFGTEMHSFLEADFKGLNVFIPQEYEKGWGEWQRMKKDAGIALLGAEKVVFNDDYGYAGRLDLILTYKGRKCIADLKTGNYFSVKTGWQLASYLKAYEKMTGEKNLGMVGIHIPRNGGMPKILAYEHIDFCWETYLACLQTFKALYFNKLKAMDWPWLTKGGK